MSTNNVTLTSSLIKSITYVDNSFVITSGESSDLPPTITAPASGSNEWTISVDCDRKGSSPVAESFNQATGGSIHEYAPDGGGTGKSPDELNFYLAVTIAWQVDNAQVPTTVYLAQGSYGVISTNNWWIGGNGVVNQCKPPLLLVLNNNSIVEMLNISGSTSSFSFTSV